MREPAKITHIDPRWPIALTIIAVFSLLILLPGRVRAFPAWVSYVLVMTLIVPMVGLKLSSSKARWLRIESIATLVFLVIVGFGIVKVLAYLITSMVHRSAGITGLQLLTSSIGVWATNVLVFSVVYWRTDRGGPEARANHANTKPDWLFPQEEDLFEDATPGWHPSFVDYLFLAFCAATAFSPTDALPLTSRAKLLMMLESIISLVTIVAVVSRAINILGS